MSNLIRNCNRCGKDFSAPYKECLCEDCLKELGLESTPQTNADHIRSMTDEELAKFLLEIMSNSVCFGEGMFPYHPCPQDQDCKKCGLNWLKQLYKEDEFG